ncbi:hypothetical protein [Phenylobacterium ferrooxidans]|uniref:Uncharacterized protein n=1 Tax=Phenylobacterium ferrooxidans TaxID=2982689 RepID=A0ABW6CN48_9CAUL
MKRSRHPLIAYLCALGLLLFAVTVGTLVQHGAGQISGLFFAAVTAMVGGAEIQERWP